MAEIFISYKSERRAAAEHFAEVLKRYGYSVWFDYELVKGKDFAAQIERQIREAKALVALWCSLSVSSRWVREEVHLAHDLGILVPVKIEPCEIPFGFRLADTIDLAGWDGSPRSPALDPLIDALEGRIGRDAVPERKALIEYETTWRRFGGSTLKDFALNARVETAEGPRFQLPGGEGGGHKEQTGGAGNNADNGLLTLAAAEWAKIKDTAGIAALKRFAQHFAKTYYAELAEERIAALEEAARVKAAAEAEARAKAQAEAKSHAPGKRRGWRSLEARSATLATAIRCFRFSRTRRKRLRRGCKRWASSRRRRSRPASRIPSGSSPARASAISMPARKW